MFRRIKELYDYRTMISSLVRRDLKSRYSGSVLGVLWNFLSPLFQLLVYSVVFSQIIRMGIDDYYMFLFVALIPWIFFSTCISGGVSCIQIQGDMIKKIYFPREVVPFSYVTSQFVNMLLCFVVIFVVMAFGGYVFNPVALLCLPVVMIIEFILALGFTLVLSSLNVYFRDLQHIMGIVALAWQFLTPIMYPMDIVPDGMKWILNINPMTNVISCYRSILYLGQVPQLNSLLTAVVLGIFLFGMGWFSFNKLQKHFIEVL